MFLLSDYRTLFCIAFGLMLLFTFIMKLQSNNFYTWDVVIKKFSIMDLEIPATPTELVNLIKGVYLLPEPGSKKTLGALKGQLFIDFLFMPFAYGSIYLLCMLVSAKMQSPFGITVFNIMAWLQPVAWLCDIIENIYLLQKIRPDPVLSTPSLHKAYLYMEALKWGIALIAAVSAFGAICYFWLSGHYAQHTINYLLVVIGEIILFLISGMLFKKTTQLAV